MYRYTHQPSYRDFANASKFRQKFYNTLYSNGNFAQDKQNKHEKDVYVNGRMKLTTLFLPLAISCALCALGYFFVGGGWLLWFALAWISMPIVTVIYVYLTPSSKLKQREKDIT